MRKFAYLFPFFVLGGILLFFGGRYSYSAETAPSSSPQTQPARAKSSPGAKVFFANLKNGATVTNPIKIVFGAKGIEITPAGEVKDNSGHHHLLIDVATLPAMDQALPMTDQIRHFGKGQTETEITLSPGPHTLQLLLAGGNHVPNNPPVMSKKIKITVQ